MDIITGGFIGSVITLIIKFIIEACSSQTAYKESCANRYFSAKQMPLKGLCHGIRKP